jgi:nitrite reductase/ring-hydroxylating ferredoxin subunit
MLVLLFDSLAAAKQEIPLNKAKRIVVERKAYCLVHTKNGFVITDDQCPHLGESLSRGKINYLNEIVCPWHSYRFSLATGNETTEKRCKSLCFYEIVFENDKMYLQI